LWGKGRNLKILDVLARFPRAKVSAARARIAATPSGRQLSVPPTTRAQEGLPAPDRGDPAAAEPSLADQSFPGLEVAKDPELMREVFQGHLRPLDGKDYQEVRECRIDYILYRRATRCMRCVVQYALRLAEPETGRERSQWVSGVMYAGDRTRRKWEKLRRSEPGLETTDACPGFAPFSYIPDLEMLVQVFPYDHRLPALPLLMEGPPPELEPLLLERFGPGDWRVEAWDVEPLKYMAELRATFRLTAQARDTATGRAEERRFYAKVYHDEEVGEQTYQVLRALWDNAGTEDASFTGGKTIAYLGSLRVLVQEEARGTPLGEVLVRGDEAVPAVRKVARALAALHLGRVVAPLRRYPLQKEVALLQRRGELLRLACPQRGPEIEETVGVVIAGLEEVPPAPTHCDLKLDHILLDGDDLTLLDFDVFAGADPILDVASVLARIISMPLGSSLPHERAQRLARAFAEEYFAHAPKAWRTRLPFHYAGAVLRIASGIFSVRMPGWPDKVEVLLGEAKDSLEGRVW
jgi:GNAT superfamily N-acetyltransferase